MPTPQTYGLKRGSVSVHKQTDCFAVLPRVEAHPIGPSKIYGKSQGLLYMEVGNPG